MDSTDLVRYKQLLLDKQRELLGTRNGTAAPVPSAADTRGDVLDQASAETEAKIQARLRQTESHLLRAIEDALARIEQGTFGICASCKGLISDARLNAVPWARMCRNCKEQNQT